MKSFTYWAPHSLPEARSLVAENEGSKILAGGTDLLVKMKRGAMAPRVIVDIKNIKELTGISVNPSGEIWVGSLVTLTEMARSQVIREKLPVLAATAAKMASMQVRNRATVGGNLCNAAPSADLAPPLIVLGAQVIISGAEGERRLPLIDFFRGPGATVLALGEIMTGVTIKTPDPEKRFIYLKHGIRQAMDIAMVGVAVGLLRDELRCLEADVVLGAVGPVPLPAVSAARLLVSGGLTLENIRKAAETAMDEASPISDVRASAAYRKEMVGVLLEKAVFEALVLKEGGV